jgi:PAS domain-containing protein
MADRVISKLFTHPTLAAVLRYGLAVLFVGIALAITLIMHLHRLRPRFVSHFILLAIAISFWIAGTGPGVLAFLLSCLGVSLFAKNHILLPDFPLWSFLSFFSIFSLLMGWFAASRRRAQKQLTEARDTLVFRVAERTNELQRSEKELRELIDTIPAKVWSALPDGSNACVNRRFIEYSGMSAEQMAGSGWQAATHPDDLQQRR